MVSSWTATSSTSSCRSAPFARREEEAEPRRVHASSAPEAAPIGNPLDTNSLEDGGNARELGPQGAIQSSGGRSGRQLAPVGGTGGREHARNEGEIPRDVTSTREPTTWAHGTQQGNKGAVIQGPIYEMTVRLVTGRTHQVRAQLAAVGSPILGDSMYAPLEGALVPAEGPAEPRLLEGVEASVPVNGPIGLHAASLSWRGRTWVAPPPWT